MILREQRRRPNLPILLDLSLKSCNQSIAFRRGADRPVIQASGAQQKTCRFRGRMIFDAA
jgi:hypothetical protein